MTYPRPVTRSAGANAKAVSSNVAPTGWLPQSFIKVGERAVGFEGEGIGIPGSSFGPEFHFGNTVLGQQFLKVDITPVNLLPSGLFPTAHQKL